MSSDPQARRRQNDQEIDEKTSELHGYAVNHRLYLLWLTASIIAAIFLGWALIVGVWTHYRAPFSVLGFAAATVSTASAVWLLLRARPVTAKAKYDLSVLETEQLHLAAAEAADATTALRIYRVASLRYSDQLRRSANRSRHVANTLQWAIIVGSVSATSLTSAVTGNEVGLQAFRWIAAVVSAIVSIAAGITGFFKFRERSAGQQQTADAIERHCRAVELGIGDYTDLAEDKALRKFAAKIEELKDEQKKRELQLEQSSSGRREHQTA